MVDDYLAAAGVLMTMRAGIDPGSVRRPLRETRIIATEVDDGA